MHHFFVSPEQIHIDDKSVIIIGSDVNHIKNVLRMKEGEEIAVSNGIDGKEYRCGILSFAEDAVYCGLRFIKEDGVELPAEIYLFQGLPKADKMELIVQKAVELGVTEIIPVAAKRCVVKLDDRKAKSKTARWQGIAEAAAKQSRRARIPQVLDVMSFRDAVDMAARMDVKLIPYELAEVMGDTENISHTEGMTHTRNMNHTRSIMEKIKPGEKIAVFIGPEGGFEESEIQLAMENKVEPITLGKRILRTETAGFTVLSWLIYLLEGKEF